MRLPRSPKFRLFVRLVTYIALKSFALGFAESLLAQRDLDLSLHLAQAFTVAGTLFFGIGFGVVGVLIAVIFGYEPNARRFKLAMALAIVALPALLIIATVSEILRNSYGYSLEYLVLQMAHAAVAVWISQIAARKYLAEQYASLQREKA